MSLSSASQKIVVFFIVKMLQRKLMLAILSAMVLIVILCTLSQVLSQRDFKEVPSLPYIPKYDIMPLVKYIKNREELQNTEWVSLLYNFLRTLDRSVSPHVNVVFGDSNHSRLLENWITAAMIRLKPPLHNLMVLSLDYSLCNQLLSRKIPHTCIPVPPQSLIVAHPNGTNTTWSSAMMIRQIVLRLINYWGYDVASYDSDAVLLHNPQVLYDAQPYVDVFSASSKGFPWSLSAKWGFNLCGGILMLRASPEVGVYILTVVHSCPRYEVLFYLVSYEHEVHICLCIIRYLWVMEWNCIWDEMQLYNDLAFATIMNYYHEIFLFIQKHCGVTYLHC